MKHTGALAIACAVVCLAVASFLIFQNLSAPAIRIWDEAIYADNALDMYTYGDPIVLKRNGELTLYNTKPPLVIWLQTLSMHVFGVNEFAVRFPSAIAGVLTCMLLLLFSIYTMKDVRIGIIAVIVLATSYGFVRQHVVKTGDLDAVLVFWTTFYTLLCFDLLLRDTAHVRRLILWCGTGIAAAFLAKGVAGLAACVLVTRKFKWFVTQHASWVATAGVIVVIAGFYFLRESLAPGFFSRTLQADYSRFTTDHLAWHHHPWYYYIQNWYSLEFFTPWVFWLPFAAAFGLASIRLRQAAVLILVQLLVFVGIFSYPKVKLMWYDAPVYPLLALLCAIGLITAWDWVKHRLALKPAIAQTTLVGLCIALFFLPVRKMYERNTDLYLPVDILEREGFFLRDLHRNHPDLKDINVLMLAGQNAHYTQVDFYMNVYNRYEGYRIALYRDTPDVRSGDTIACCQEDQIAWLREHFVLEELSASEIGCVLVRVEEAKAKAKAEEEY
jgi:4-amino-4-deoxy-L-arabinose transferase-like glycosyltransferase